MTRLFFLLAGLLLLAAPARAEYFTIENYRVDIRVEQSGEFLVVETIDVNFFAERHGIFRFMPYRYRIDGKTQKIKYHNVKVDGWPVEKDWDFQNITLKIGDADKYVYGPQRYVIRYKVKDAWLFTDEHTEFYWNLTGNQWETPIKKVEYRIEFAGSPNLVEGDYFVYTGGYGQRGTDATIHYRGGAIGGQSQRELGSGEGLTVAVKLPYDYIYRPTETELFIRQYGLLGVPLALIVALIGIWFKHGKDEEGTLVVQYYPPADFPPAEAGGFIDDKIDNRDLICMIPYWGSQGYLEMTEKQEKMLVFTQKDYEFKKLNNLPGTRPQYERTMFNGLFSRGNVVELSDLKNTFYTTMSNARSDLKHAIHNRMLYTPVSRNLYQWWIPAAAALCLPLGVLFFFLEQLPAAIGMVVLGAAGFIMRRPMLRRTTEGSEIYQHLRGFREFVKMADQPRIERLLKDDPGYFDKTLPYAIAFNMAKEWSKKFDGLFTEPPTWYHGYYVGGHYGSNFGNFADDFSSSMNEVQSVFTSQPSSSGGGGGGGGFSGGGFGGGGGGSW